MKVVGNMENMSNLKMTYNTPKRKSGRSKKPIYSENLNNHSKIIHVMLC